MDDQHRFAALSGDYNPMHMDPLVARRLPAGRPVVHGVQALLWALQALLSVLPPRPLQRVEADFARFLRVDEACELFLTAQSDASVTAELRAGSVRVALYRLHFAAADARSDTIPDTGAGNDPVTPDDPGEAAGTVFPVGTIVPAPLEWADVAAASGAVLFHRPGQDATDAYPALAAAIGAGRVAALCAASRLVGMVSPGLHSTFHRLDVEFVPPGHTAPDRLRFRTIASESRFRVVTLAVSADGLRGRIRASRRAPPRAQPSSCDLAAAGAIRRYPGNAALVVGGSRGIGEVTAKLLGLAGVDTTIGYAAGRAEAEAVADDIRAAGGTARTARLDVLSPLPPQLDALPVPVGSAYFFATPRIDRHPGPYSPELFARYCRFYVDAFGELCLHLAAGNRDLRTFYPSSSFVADPPVGFAEYAMAKAAGEILAANLGRSSSRLRVEILRLPRLPTDQTAGLDDEGEAPSIAGWMVPAIDRVECRPGTST